MTTQQVALAQDSLRAAMFLIYADPKEGKTSLLLRTFPRAIMIGVRSAISLPAQNTCGFTPEPWQVVENISALPDLITFLNALRGAEWQAAIKRLGIDSIFIDDLSHICTKSVLNWGAMSSGDKYFKWNQLDQHLDMMTSAVRELGLLCGVSMHKTSPFWGKDGKLSTPGAPEVPSRGQIQAVPGWADFVAPIQVKAGLDPWWERVISVEKGADKTWISGDRNNVCWEDTPANLREILRASKTRYNLARLPGMEWQDEVAEIVANALDKGEPLVGVAQRMFTHYGDYARPGTPGERHVQWAVQDGIARHVIRKRQNAGVLGALIDTTAAKAAANAPPPAIVGAAK